MKFITLIAVTVLTVGLCEVMSQKPMAAWPEKPVNGFALPCVVDRVYDGDTLTVTVKLTTSVRLLDCWAPEVTGDEKPRGLVSAAKLREMAEGKTGIVWVPVGDTLQQSLTFGRVLGHVWIDGHDRPLSQQMVEAGLATKAKVAK